MKNTAPADQYRKHQDDFERQRAQPLEKSNGFTFINLFLQRLVMGDRK